MSRRTYSIIFRSESGKEKSLIVSRVVIYLALFVLFLFTVLSASIILHSPRIFTTFQDYHRLEQERDSLKVVATEVTKVKEKIIKIDTYISYIREISRITGKKPLPSLTAFVKSDSLKENFIATNMEDEFLATPNIRPVSGWLSNGFNLLDHPALDYAAPTGTPIKATANGTIKQVYFDENLGNVVVIQHGYGYKTLYAHCNMILAKEKQSVVRGDIIATVGNSGKSSTGPHLHYEVTQNGKIMNPQTLLISGL